MLVRLSPDGKAVDVAPPTPLFQTRIRALSTTILNTHQYAVSPDGPRFLINVNTEDISAAPITVILNWKPKTRP